MDQDLQEANDRLKQKRVELKVTGSPFPSMSSVLSKADFHHDSSRDEESHRREKARKDKIEQEEKERTKRLFNNPGNFMNVIVPPKFKDCSMDTFKGGEGAKAKCMEFVNEYGKRPGIFFHGATGSGKTHLAIATTRELVRRNHFSMNREYGVMYVTMPELLMKIRETYNSSSSWTETEVVDRYSRCQLLVLDDVGAEKVSDFSITTLYLIIDRRSRDLRPTIVTSNLSLDDISSLLDARIASRLSEMKIIQLAMADYRKKRS